MRLSEEPLARVLDTVPHVVIKDSLVAAASATGTSRWLS
jgi:hypothetical protein